MSTKLAEFTSAPKGSEWKTKVGQWQSAQVGTPLYTDYECRNTQQNDYGLEVYSEVEIQFPDGITDVTASTYQGTAEYLDSSQTWVTLPLQTVQANAIRTGTKSILPVVIAAGRGYAKPRGW